MLLIQHAHYRIKISDENSVSHCIRIRDFCCNRGCWDIIKRSLVPILRKRICHQSLCAIFSKSKDDRLLYCQCDKTKVIALSNFLIPNRVFANICVYISISNSTNTLLFCAISKQMQIDPFNVLRVWVLFEVRVYVCVKLVSRQAYLHSSVYWSTESALSIGLSDQGLKACIIHQALFSRVTLTTVLTNTKQAQRYPPPLKMARLCSVSVSLKGPAFSSFNQ